MPIAGVAHAHDRVVAVRVEFDRHDSPPAGRVTNRVVDQIHEDLRQTVGVGFDRTGRIGRSSSDTPLFAACGSNERDDRMRNFFEIDLAQIELQLSRLGARLFEQLLHERRSNDRPAPALAARTDRRLRRRATRPRSRASA